MILLHNTILHKLQHYQVCLLEEARGRKMQIDRLKIMLSIFFIYICVIVVFENENVPIDFVVMYRTVVENNPRQES